MILKRKRTLILIAGNFIGVLKSPTTNKGHLTNQCIFFYLNKTKDKSCILKFDYLDYLKRCIIIIVAIRIQIPF